MKKHFKTIIGGLLALGLLALILFNKTGLLSKQNDRSGFVSGKQSVILPVHAMVMREAPLNDVLVAAGSVMADEQVEIAAEASGRITKIHFTEGSSVKAGDLLITINNADLLAQADRNNFQLKLAESREERQKQLLEKQGISQQTYDQVLTELNALRAEAALLVAQLDKTRIKAPFAGLVGLRYLSEGSFVSPGTKIVRLARVQPVKIEFSVPERYVQYVHNGVSINFKVDNSAETYSAKIYAIEPVIDMQSRSITGRALYENKTGEVIPGSFARVELPLMNLSEVLQVKAEALIPEMGKNKVFVYRNGKAQPQNVTIGIRTERMVQITEGLQQGDTVITTGLLQLRPGMAVELRQLDQP
ncbi:MAG: membrane fusion protein [Bacteroidetes bacterium]|nr:MAG: membrane fusion protein [Bacteroidota bacterium]